MLHELEKALGARLRREPFALNVAAAAIAYMVAYCVLGTIAWRFVREFYTDPVHGLHLRVSSARRDPALAGRSRPCG